MSISGSLSNALSGLSMNSRAAEIVSNNIANAMTPGYGRRILETSARQIALGGVQIDGITRVGDPRLLLDRRNTDAELGAASVGADAAGRLADVIGTPDSPTSLSARVAELEARLASVASDPSVPLRSELAIGAARDLVTSVNELSDAIQTERKAAEQGIVRAVDTLNANLEQVHRLNVAISHARNTTGDSSALEDQRQVLVDEIAELVPVREFERANGVIALMSTGGQMLLDGPAKTFAFTATNEITADLTFAGGFLEGLTFDGDPVSIEANSKLAGGKLIAYFDIRDRTAVTAQADLDSFARDLVERFQTPAVDPTLGVGDAGLLTDGGSAFVATDERGLSSRLSLNALVDPNQGGDAWRLRDGLGAAGQGAVGDATIINNIRSALTGARIAASGPLAGQTVDAREWASTLTSALTGAAERADRDVSFAAARNTELRSIELSKGVDTDAELQRLLVIERLYAANARVIETVDEMLNAIMRI